MRGQEKGVWVFVLWFTSLLTIIWLLMSIYDPSPWTEPLIMFMWMFVIALIAWLFRITYLAGRRR